MKTYLTTPNVPGAKAANITMDFRVAQVFEKIYEGRKKVLMTSYDPYSHEKKPLLAMARDAQLIWDWYMVELQAGNGLEAAKAINAISRGPRK